MDNPTIDPDKRLVVTARDFFDQPPHVQEALLLVVNACQLQLKDVWRVEQEASRVDQWLVTYWIRNPDKGNMIAFDRRMGDGQKAFMRITFDSGLNPEAQR